MMDELIPETPFTPSRQNELIAHHCSDALERIRTSPSKSEARRIVDEFCQKFDQECDSAMVRKFLKQYVNSLLNQHWGERV
jgi:hypothetical protein